MGLLKSLRRRWRSGLNRIQLPHGESSLSDVATYRRFCDRSASSNRHFRSFRRHRICELVVETVSPRIGRQYLEVLEARPFFREHLQEIRRNDEVGGPRIAEYPRIGSISPTTLRYAKVLTDLEDHFQSLDGLRICEIGVGYGGQCRLIHAFAQPSLYRLVDLPEPLKLARRYLAEFGVSTPLDFRGPDAVEADDYDLVISNYAFSELRRSVQEAYFDKILSRSAHGYMTCNFVEPSGFDQLTENDYLQRIPGARALAEIPETERRNRIIVW